MSTAFTSEATIDRPVGDVWDALTRWDKAHAWLGVDWVKAEGATAPGTQLKFHVRGKERPAEIASCDPERSLVLRSVQDGVTADYTYTLEAVGESTKVTLVAGCQSEGVKWRVIWPLLRFVMWWTDRGQVEKLKQLAEER